MIPIRDSQWRTTTPYVTRALIVINVLVFLLMFVMNDTPTRAVFIIDDAAITEAGSPQAAEAIAAADPRLESAGEFVFPRRLGSDVFVRYPVSPRDEFTLRFGAVPEFITGEIDGNSTSHDVVELQGVQLFDGLILLLLTPLFAMFLHGGFLHLIGNMLFLWVFADNVEDRLGHVRFALFYMVIGYAAVAAHILIDSGDLVPMIGASGAISGVLGAYLLLFPRSMIQVLIPIIFFIPAVIPAPLMIGFWFLLNLISGVGSIASDAVGSGGTAWFAHIGGFVAGMALIYPFLIGRWRAPAGAIGPTWNLPPSFGFGFGARRHRQSQRQPHRPPPLDTTATPDTNLLEFPVPPARRARIRSPLSLRPGLGRRRLPRLRRRKKPGGIDAFRNPPDRDPPR